MTDEETYRYWEDVHNVHHDMSACERLWEILKLDGEIDLHRAYKLFILFGYGSEPENESKTIYESTRHTLQGRATELCKTDPQLAFRPEENKICITPIGRSYAGTVKQALETFRQSELCKAEAKQRLIDMIAKRETELANLKAELAAA